MPDSDDDPGSDGPTRPKSALSRARRVARARPTPPAEPSPARPERSSTAVLDNDATPAAEADPAAAPVAASRAGRNLPA
ncbi:MAG: hypothetical protein INR67_16830, partial [Jatrophihabitans endophyticus]